MGFFFTKATKAAKPKRTGAPRKAGTGIRATQDVAALRRLGCRACPLNNSGEKREPFLPDEVDIYFLNDKPKRTKRERELLEGEIPDWLEERYAIGGIVWHQPPNGRQPAWAEFEACRGHVTANIELARPRLIVGLGSGVLQWALGSNDMIGMRGRLFAIQIGNHKCWFMPVHDPDYVYDMAFNKERPLYGKVGQAFKADLAKAFSLAKGKLKPPQIESTVEAKTGIDTFSGPSGFDELLAHFERASKSKKRAIDWETYPLRPYSPDAVIVTAAISYHHKDEQRTYAFAVDHPKAGWTNKQKEQIREQVRKLFSDKKATKIAHNVPFELEWMIWYLGGLDFVDHHGWEDTMLQAHFLDERKGQSRGENERAATYQNLDFLTKQHFGLAIKGLFKLDKKDMRKSDLQQCLVYNGVDAKYTLRLHDHQEVLIEQDGITEAYEFAIPRQTTVAIMQHLGMEVDQDVVNRLCKKLEDEIKDIRSEIDNLKVVKHYKRDNGSFNPQSNDEVLIIFRDYLKRKEVEKGEGKFSVDKGALEPIDHPLAGLIMRLRNREKLKSTYLDGHKLGTGKVIYPDGNLHSTFNTTFTTTGRLSSDGPNLQNFPKREDSWIREQIKPKKGYVIIAVDYGQLEWCCGCMCTRDKAMVDATWKEYDVHMAWALKIAHKWPELVGTKADIKDPAKMKKARGKVKNKMVFPAIFGASQTSIAGYLNMPQDIADEIFDEFWATFPGLKDWQDRTMRGYYDVGYVETLTGRRRRLPMTRSEAINSPIQGTAADLVVDAMDRMSLLALETDRLYLHPRMNIHDDLTFVVPDTDRIVEESIEDIYRTMLTYDRFDFINVPMSVEVSLGPNWYEMEELGKFWSHKDL